MGKVWRRGGGGREGTGRKGGDNILRTFSGLSQDIPRTMDFYKTFSGLFQEIPRTSLGLSHDFLRTLSELSRDIL